MDDIFLQHRLKLIDLNANLEKQEVLFRPMIEADQPDETKILAQIDAVAQSRAELEKANARMLFDLRKVLTPEQWQKMKAMHREHRDRDGMRGDRRGPWGPGDHPHMGPNGGAPPPPPAQPDNPPQGQAPAPPQ
jgi:Spy/CpxP family protein refolding chaperone